MYTCVIMPKLYNFYSTSRNQSCLGRAGRSPATATRQVYSTCHFANLPTRMSDTEDDCAPAIAARPDVAYLSAEPYHIQPGSLALLEDMSCRLFQRKSIAWALRGTDVLPSARHEGRRVAEEVRHAPTRSSTLERPRPQAGEVADPVVTA